jgi:uncharacterized YigZ family protein
LAADGYKLSRYHTIATPSTGEYQEKGSTFLSFVYPIATEEDFKQQLLHLKHSHPNAVHFCYAYRLGVNSEHFRFSDDGEPSNSAGKPIYGQLLSFDVTNIALVVVRYYGGVKLGVGGLITAYKLAAKSSLLQATIQTFETQFVIIITFPYEKTATINQFIHAWQPTILTQKFEDQCTFRFSFPDSKYNAILAFAQAQNEFTWKVE